MKYAGRTRVSFFGKRIRDSVNESTETNLDILLSESAEFLFDE